MTKRVLCILLSAALVWSNLVLAFETTRVVPSAETEEGDAGFAALFDRLDRLQQLLDRSQFDLDALLEILDYDAERITEFVRDEIRFQAYEGVLRGAVGTLVSRSGNTLDQSVLLARLLKDSGYDARIVRGRLSRSYAAELLESMFAPAQWPSPVREAGRMQNMADLAMPAANVELDVLVRNVAEEIRPGMVARSQKIEALQSSIVQLEREGMGNGDVQAFETELLAEQNDYFWVEYRLDATSDWHQSHPAFQKTVPEGIEAVEYFTDEIPQELQHRVRYQVFVETGAGDRATIHPLMSAWERPAANAAHIPQSIMLMPVTEFAQDGRFDLQSGLEKARFFGVYLNGSLAPGANVFTLDGLVGPPDALTGEGAFIAEVAGKGLQAADALARLGSVGDKASSRLSRVWFEYTLIAPGGKKRVIERDVFSTTSEGHKVINGKAVDSADWHARARQAFAQSRDLVVSTGPVNPTYAVAKNIEYAERARGTFEKLRQFEREGRLEAAPQILEDLEPLANFRIVDFLAMANASTGFEKDAATYSSTPMVASFNRGIREANGDLRQFEQTDVLFNARRAIAWHEGTLQRARDRSVLRGIWDTYLESVSLSSRHQVMAEQSAFSLLSEGGQNLHYIASSEVAKLDDFDLEPYLRDLARDELESGYALIIPEQPRSDGAGWWRVDAETGTVLGMMVGPGGYGGATAVEYLLYLSITVATLLMYWSFYSCFKNESGLALFCCLVDSWLTGIVVAILAFITAQLLTLGAGAVAVTMEASSAAAELVSAIAAAFLLDVPSAFVSFTDFRLRACGTITGSG